MEKKLKTGGVVKSDSTRRPKLGLCPIGKFVFSHEAAVECKRRLQAMLRKMDVDFVDLDGVIEDGMVRSQEHVDPAVEHLRQAEVDALFLPHCNFGTEGAAGMIARKLGVPTLLWGPRDEAPSADGTRRTDSLCGLFATSKVLHKLGVRFTYIENCRLDEPVLRNGIDQFLRAANVARVFREGARIGHVGQRIDFFWSTIVNESELLERFRVETLPLDMLECVEHIRDRAARGRSGYAKEAAGIRRSLKVEGYDDDAPLILLLAMRDHLLAVAADKGLDALAIQDFMSLANVLGTYDFFAVSMLSDRIPVGIESDIHGAISCLMLSRADYGAPIFLADITARHPEDDNGVLIWHSGGPLSMRHPKSEARIGRHWILPSPLSGMPHFQLRDGDMTLARFDGDGGSYKLAAGEARSMKGPRTLNNYLWAKVSNWSRWERTLIEGPFIHHAAMGYGRRSGALAEACKFIDGLEFVDLDKN